jgi:hypothetical protein
LSFSFQQNWFHLNRSFQAPVIAFCVWHTIWKRKGESLVGRAVPRCAVLACVLWDILVTAVPAGIGPGSTDRPTIFFPHLARLPFSTHDPAYPAPHQGASAFGCRGPAPCQQQPSSPPLAPARRLPHAARRYLPPLDRERWQAR